jgi:hypothetical protein
MGNVAFVMPQMYGRPAQRTLRTLYLGCARICIVFKLRLYGSVVKLAFVDSGDNGGRGTRSIESRKVIVVCKCCST